MNREKEKEENEDEIIKRDEEKDRETRERCSLMTDNQRM